MLFFFRPACHFLFCPECCLFCPDGRLLTLSHFLSSRGVFFLSQHAWKHPCKAFVRSSGSCSIEIQDRSSGQKDGVVQGFPRKSSEASGFWRKSLRGLRQRRTSVCRKFQSEHRLAQLEAQAQKCFPLKSQWRSCRRGSTFCSWQQPPQFGQGQCGWERSTSMATFLRCPVPLSRTWNIG